MSLKEEDKFEGEQVDETMEAMIQPCTVDLTTNELAQILTEAKSQLAIFKVLTDYAVHISYVVT